MEEGEVLPVEKQLKIPEFKRFRDVILFIVISAVTCGVSVFMVCVVIFSLIKFIILPLIHLFFGAQ